MRAPFGLDFLTRRPYRELHPRFRRGLEPFTDWPAPTRYDELAQLVPRAAEVQLPRFITESREAVRRLGGYEQHVAQLSAVPTRLRIRHIWLPTCSLNRRSCRRGTRPQRAAGEP